MYIKGEYTHSITIEKSEFICYLKRIDDIDGFNDYLSAIKKRHYDATHHCSAYIGKDVRRSNDDGEPSGSAGLPILTALEKSGLSDVGAIVVRYFGGIKLGMGGLIRAYGKAVSETLKIATFTQEKMMLEYRLTLPYDIASKIDHLLRTQTIILNVDYGVDVTYDFLTEKNIDEKIAAYTKGIMPSFIKEQCIEVDV